jgi:Protein of unknown function (DUF1302)
MVNKGGMARSLVALGAAAALMGPAYSYDFKLGENINGSLISQVTAGLGLRLRDQNFNLIAAPGPNSTAGTFVEAPGFFTGFQDAHTGDLNYESGDLFALYLKGSEEMLLKFPDKYKLFIRGSWLLDAKAGDTQFVPLDSGARTQAAHDLRLYDFWGSKDFELFGNSARLRLGRQVINWGESLFIAGGVNATAAIDQYRYTYPGVPLKEVVLPAEIVSLALSPIKGLNVEGYYQFRWNQNHLVPVGTFFSTSDYLGEGKQTNWFAYYDPKYAARHGGVYAPGGPFTGPPVTDPNQAVALAALNGYTFCAAVDVTSGTCFTNYGSPYVAPDQTPSVGRQFGLSAHYKPQGSSMDFGVYYEHFHEKQPYVQYVPAANVGLGYGQRVVYPNDHNLFGVSMSALVGQWALGSEISYRPKDPILVDPFSCIDLNPLFAGGADCKGNWATYRDAHKWQWNTTWWRAVNPSDTDIAGWLIRHAGAQASNIQGEFALVHYPGVSDNSYQGLGLLTDLSYDLGQASPSGVNKNARHFGTADSFGVVQYLDMTYDGTIVPGFQIIPNITWAWAIAGDTPNENYTWMQGALATTYALTVTQNKGNWSGSFLYVTYRGGDPSILRNFYADRDWLGLQVTFTY